MTPIMPDQTSAVFKGLGARRVVPTSPIQAILGVCGLVLALSACQATPTETTTSTTSTEPVGSTLSDVTTTVTQPGLPATERFIVPVGETGVIYQLDGQPPSGPSSFAVLDDGGVVIADTMAADRGKPRLLHYDRTGEQISIIDLAGLEVASIADVVSDGENLAVLDIRIELEKYRVLQVSIDGESLSEIEVPTGFRFEDGLTGLVWDDSGVLLEFELGARYARIGDDGSIEDRATPIFDGLEVEVVEGEGRETSVRIGDEAWTIERATDLGGATLVGVSPDQTVVLVVDEVDTTGPAFEVLRRVQRYSLSGELLSESLIYPGEQRVEIMRPLELSADGTVLYLASLDDRVEVTPEPFETTRMPEAASFRTVGGTIHTKRAIQWAV